jgi:hypothetical protein
VTVAELEQIKAEQALAEQLSEYAGEWVAVCNHTIVAHADTLDQLREQIEQEEIEVEGVFRVPEGDTSACFF